MNTNNITIEEYENLSKEEKEKLYNEIPEKDKEVMKQKTEILIQALPYVLMARAKTAGMLEATMLGSISQEYCEKFKCTLIEFMTDIQTLVKVFVERSIQSEGISFDEKVYQVPDRLKKKNKENHEEIEKEKKISMGNQMADALKRAGVAKG